MGTLMWTSHDVIHANEDMNVDNIRWCYQGWWGHGHIVVIHADEDMNVDNIRWCLMITWSWTAAFDIVGPVEDLNADSTWRCYGLWRGREHQKYIMRPQVLMEAWTWHHLTTDQTEHLHWLVAHGSFSRWTRAAAVRKCLYKCRSLLPPFYLRSFHIVILDCQ